MAVDKILADKVSGRNTQRPKLDDLRQLVRDLTRRGVRVEFVKEYLTFTGDDAPMATLLLSIMGSFSEFERTLLRERQMEGIALAEKRGVYTGRKTALTVDQVVDIRERVEAGETKAALAREYEVSRETLYQHLRGN